MQSQRTGGQPHGTAAFEQPGGRIRIGDDLDICGVRCPDLVEFLESPRGLVADRCREGRAGRCDLAHNAPEKKGLGDLGARLQRVEVPAALVLHEGERGKLPRARFGLTGLQVGEANDRIALECGAQRLERGIPHAQPGGISQHRLIGDEPESLQLDHRATGFPGERSLSPHHRREVEQGGLLGGEGDVVRQLIAPSRDAVTQVLVVSGLAGSIHGLEWHTQVADVVFVAFELALEVGVVTAGTVPLAIPLHGREHFILGEAGLGREQCEHETEQSLLDRNSGDACSWHGDPGLE